MKVLAVCLIFLGVACLIMDLDYSFDEDPLTKVSNTFTIIYFLNIALGGILYVLSQIRDLLKERLNENYKETNQSNGNQYQRNNKRNF